MSSQYFSSKKIRSYPAPVRGYLKSFISKDTSRPLYLGTCILRLGIPKYHRNSIRIHHIHSLSRMIRFRYLGSRYSKKDRGQVSCPAALLRVIDTCSFRPLYTARPADLRRRSYAGTLSLEWRHCHAFAPTWLWPRSCLRTLIGMTRNVHLVSFTLP